MADGVKITGIPTMEELKATPGLVSDQRFEKSAVAVIECVQEIPCNPCEKACPFGAIIVGSPITNLPVIDEDKCTGCGVCLAQCPGLAIFRVEKNYTDSTSMVEFPFEYLPLPQEGDTVPCGGRNGQYLTEGKVLKVKKTKQMDGTTLVSVEVPKQYFMDVRTICRKGGSK
ncbi:MAG: 4Fe-4S binding protein [Clostridiales bacterium]